MKNLTFFRPWGSPAGWTPTFTNDEFWTDMDGLFGGRDNNEMAKLEPRADVDETDKAFKISIDLPGLKETDVELKVDDRKLSLRAKREDVKDENTANSLRRERFFGEFVRSFRLPLNADTSAISAEMKNGVLEILVPKTGGAPSKTIPIKLS